MISKKVHSIKVKTNLTKPSHQPAAHTHLTKLDVVEASNDSFFLPNENADSFIYYDLTFTFRFKSHSIETQNDAKPILKSASGECSIQLVGVNPKPVVILP